MKTVIVALSLLCASTALFAQSPVPQNIEELRKEIETALKQTGTPGAAVVLVSDGRVEWVAGLGLADVAANRPMTAQTRMRLGSVSKEFVALAALKLQEQGKLRLTDTVQQWVPGCPLDNPWSATDPVRLEHLLEHTAGLPEMDTKEYAHSDPKPATMAEALAFDPANRRVRWRPGSRYAYSNYGTQLAAAVVEKAAGRRFEDYVRDEIFLPLGMNTAGHLLTPEFEPLTAKTYRPGGRVVPYSHILYRAAGAVSASAEDMANYLRFHLGRGSLDGRRILSPESMDRLEVPRTLPAVRAGVTTGYGLFNGSGFTKTGYEAHGHAGEVDGALAVMGYIPELGIGRVIMINAANHQAMGRIRWQVDRYLERNLKNVELPPPATLPAETVRSLPGYYENIAPRAEGFMGLPEHYLNLRRVAVDAQGMTWRPVLTGAPAERWVAMGDKLFRRERAAKPALAVVTGETGETWLQHDYGTWRKVSPLRVWVVLGGLALSLVLLVSSALFAVVWVPRKLLGRLPGAGPLSVRAAPLLGLGGLVGFILCYRTAGDAGYAVFGTLNAWTAGMFAASLLIPAGALWSVAAVWWHRRAPMNRVAYWHAVALALALVWLTGFCLHWGLIGVRMWA